jgi:TRAP-type C4-dicarboxylate transport system substrate-binding protein
MKTKKSANFFTLTIVLCLVFTALILFTNNVFANSYTMKGGTSVSEKVWHNILVERWAKQINDKSENQLKVENYCCAILGSDNAMGESTMMGGLQWYYTSTSNLARLVEEMGYFELPYLIQEMDDNLKIFYENGTLGGPVTEHIQKQLAKKNLRLLWISGANFRATINSKREVRVPADTQGLKLRVTSSDIEREDVAAWGGSPVPMSYGEVYTALQQGTIDGLGIGLAEAYPMKFYEVCKYAVTNNFNAYSPVILVNLDFWNSLPENLQKLVMQESDDVVMWGSKNMKDDYNEFYKQKLIENGMQVYTPTSEEMELWKKTTIDAVWPKMIGTKLEQKWLDIWLERLGQK